MKNVLLLGCAWPAELSFFARGLARVGARVFGVDGMPENMLPPQARESLSGYLQVASLFDEQAAFDEVRRWAGPVTFDHVETRLRRTAAGQRLADLPQQAALTPNGDACSGHGPSLPLFSSPLTGSDDGPETVSSVRIVAAPPTLIC